ncbi:MAG: hypothetical protein IJ325_02675 [Clostridia bacterium]|nr:hypothetical protein [Clostridia bacterium]
MKKITSHKKLWGIGLIALVVILSCGVVYALELYPKAPADTEPEVLRAADVCGEHLLADCGECVSVHLQKQGYTCLGCSNIFYSDTPTESCPYCSGKNLQAFDHNSCPYCLSELTVYCYGILTMDGYYDLCLIPDHPDTCHTVQKLCREGVYCENCAFSSTGFPDEVHIESYYHSSCPDEYRNDSYCTLPKFSVLLEQWSREAEASRKKDLQAIKQIYGEDAVFSDKPHDPVAAGDYCETHDKFACDLDHFE